MRIILKIQTWLHVFRIQHMYAYRDLIVDRCAFNACCTKSVKNLSNSSWCNVINKKVLRILHVISTEHWVAPRCTGSSTFICEVFASAVHIYCCNSRRRNSSDAADNITPSFKGLVVSKATPTCRTPLSLCYHVVMTSYKYSRTSLSVS
jgi:hypothetical protein